MASIRVRPDAGCLFPDCRHRNEMCREQTAFPDTPANHKRLQKLLDKVEAGMAAGKFDYCRFFSNNKTAKKLAQTPMEMAIQARPAFVAGRKAPIANATTAQDGWVPHVTDTRFGADIPAANGATAAAEEVHDA